MQIGYRNFPDRDQRILNLWDQGYSAGQIAQVMGANVTRQVVSGVVARAGRKRGGKVILLPRAAKIKSPPNLTLILPDEPPAIGPLEDLPEHGACQYIRGDIVPGWRACGHLTESKRHCYCQWHLDNEIRKPDGRTVDGKARLDAIKAKKRRLTPAQRSWAS